MKKERRVFVPEAYLFPLERVTAIYVHNLGVGKVYSYKEFRESLKPNGKINPSVIRDLQFKEL